MARHEDTARIIAFPPLIYGLPLLAGIVGERAVGGKPLPQVMQLVSIGCFGAAALLVVPAIAEFKKAGTAIDPFEETTALLERGPFAHTRNPLYLAMALTYAGTAFAARSTLPFAMLPGVLWLMNAGVIEREERYLERKFGNAYTEYRRRVPRWF